jgi:hypothetical protein
MSLLAATKPQKKNTEMRVANAPWFFMLEILRQKIKVIFILSGEILIFGMRNFVEKPLTHEFAFLGFQKRIKKV